MANILTAAVITLIIFAFIGFLVMVLIYKPLLTAGIIVLLCMVSVFTFIYYSLLKKQDDGNCTDF